MSSDIALKSMVEKLNSQVALDDEDRRALLDLPNETKVFKASSYIVRQGEAVGLCAVLLDGFAFGQKLANDGTRQIIALHVPGVPLDLQHLFLDRADHNVQTLTDATLALIPRPALREIAMDRPTIARAFAVSNQIEASISREWLLNIGRRDAQARVAHLLCEVAMRLENHAIADEYGYDLPMSQEQLGDATGLTAVHVNRTLKLLEARGLIRRDKRSICFPCVAALQKAADFDPAYLHLGQQAAARQS